MKKKRAAKKRTTDLPMNMADELEQAERYALAEDHCDEDCLKGPDALRWAQTIALLSIARSLRALAHYAKPSQKRKKIEGKRV